MGNTYEVCVKKETYYRMRIGSSDREEVERIISDSICEGFSEAWSVDENISTYIDEVR